MAVIPSAEEMQYWHEHVKPEMKLSTLYLLMGKLSQGVSSLVTASETSVSQCHTHNRVMSMTVFLHGGEHFYGLFQT